MAEAINASCAKLRGQFLGAGAWIEAILSDILTEEFCTDTVSKALFFSEIMDSGDITFSRKTELLETVLRHRHPTVLAAYPKLKDQLDKFRKFRNRLAHSHPDTSVDKLLKVKSGEFDFVFYKDGERRLHNITQADVRVRALESDQLIADLRAVKRLLGAE